MEPMNCDEVRDAADAYALGALDAADREELERHIEHCAECRDYVERLTLATSSLALAAPLTAAPAALHTRVMRQVEQESGSAQGAATLKRLIVPVQPPVGVPPANRSAAGRGASDGRVRWPWVQSIAAVLILLLFAASAVWIAKLQMQVSRLQARSQTLQRAASDVDLQRSALMLLASEGSVRLEMQPMDPASGVTGAVVWNPERHKCSILVSGLPAAAADQTYHIWLVGNQRSWDSGELTMSGSGAAMKTFDLNTVSNQQGYQVVVSLQPRSSSNGGDWQPVLKAWVGSQ
jgi:Anti-sigma-K factor rskA/Putative zinc-finger